MSPDRTNSDRNQDPRRDQAEGDDLRWEEEKVFGGTAADNNTSPVIGDDRQTTDRQRYLRLVADFDNFRKRVQKDRETVVIYANERLVRDMLPLVDDLERALAAQATVSSDQTSFSSGVQHILARFRSILDGAGAKPFISVGGPFNPSVHEAVFQRVEEDKAEGLVLEELEKGYLFNGKLLRPAKVVVNGLVRPPATRSIDLGASDTISRPIPRPAPTPPAAVTASATATAANGGQGLEAETPFVTKSRASVTGPQPVQPKISVAAPVAPDEPRHQVVIEDEEDLGSLEEWDLLFKSEESKGKV
jgi:molecular chaperone GrpE (heat shock protein)